MKIFATIFGIITVALAGLYLLGPSDQDPEPYQYGLLKSNPPMPPLTYTWSHPDCPFTVDFPGEPEREKGDNPSQINSTTASVSTETFVVDVICISNSDTVRSQYSFKSDEDMISSAVQQIFGQNDFSTLEIVKSGENNFWNLNNEVFQFKAKLENNGGLAMINGVSFFKNNAIFITYYGYGAADETSHNGIEFFETVRLKNSP